MSVIAVARDTFGRSLYADLREQYDKTLQFEYDYCEKKFKQRSSFRKHIALGTTKRCVRWCIKHKLFKIKSTLKKKTRKKCLIITDDTCKLRKCFFYKMICYKMILIIYKMQNIEKRKIKKKYTVLKTSRKGYQIWMLYVCLLKYKEEDKRKYCASSYVFSEIFDTSYWHYTELWHQILYEFFSCGIHRNNKFFLITFSMLSIISCILDNVN